MGGSPISSYDMRIYYDERRPEIKTASCATQVFKRERMFTAFDPSRIKLPREACDSVLSPHSRGIILAEDVTGSMDKYLLSLIKDDFPRLMPMIYDSVSYNPHIMFMGVGDVAVGDEAPLQVTQFETDLRILEQFEKIYLERGGGSNPYESYILPWYFAANHVKMDCLDKRGEKGFLFTFGDEEPTPRITANEIKAVFGENDTLDVRMLTGEDCLEMASEKFHCYHILLRGGGYCQTTIDKWRKLMGSHVCDLGDNHEYIPELVTTILRMYEGMSKTEAIDKIQSYPAKSAVIKALVWHEEVVADTHVNTENSDIDVF